ncbi:MAG: GNAT family N-acetyltransferase [Hyphomonadaceae bacterium]|jgi:RimJ/RimL family protein N-acetyltransferase|nr:GNAT family N-acetyltransferase [Hyphomonadaceae bacterium]
MARTGDTFPTLVTRRLRLRHFEPNDATDLHACFGDPDAMRFWNLPACKTVAETEKALEPPARQQLGANGRVFSGL